MIFKSSDGTLIFCESFRAVKPQGSIFVVHGLGEHSGRYQEFTKECLRLKLDVHLMDLRGHGRSQGVRGHFNSFEELHSDLDAWLDHLVGSGELSAGPSFLFGHSLGGLIATTYLAKYVAKPMYPIFAGMILSAPALGLRMNPFKVLEAKIARSIPPFFRTIQVPAGIDANLLTHDKEEVEKYKADPLVHSWITPAAFTAIEQAIATLPNLISHLDLPSLFIIPGKDKVVDPIATQKFAAKLSVAHSGKVEVKNFHSFFHESFNELKKERAYLELKKWILKCLLPTKATSSKKSSSKSSAKGATARASLH